MLPTLQSVAKAILILCHSHDRFTPSMLRQLLGKEWRDREPGALSAQLQPHLRALREAGVVEIIRTHQQRNRPHRLINKELLIEVAESVDYILPHLPQRLITQDDESDKPDEQNSLDEETNLNIELERRVLALEETVELLVEKLAAVSTVLRPR